MKINKYNAVLILLFLIQTCCLAEPWPDSPEKQSTLKRCAEFLVSSINTNQVEFVCAKMSTNLSPIIRLENQATKNNPVAVTVITNKDLVSSIKGFSGHIELDLNNYAAQLTAKNLNTFRSEVGNCAEVITPKQSAFYNIWFNNGPVKNLVIRSASGNVTASLQFYQNGKLKLFKGNSSHKESASFDETGGLTCYSWVTDGRVEVDVNFDNAGNVKIRGFDLNL